MKKSCSLLDILRHPPAHTRRMGKIRTPPPRPSRHQTRNHRHVAGKRPKWYRHPNDFKLGIRPMNASDIIEVDNLSELIALDESYKKYVEEK